MASFFRRHAGRSLGLGLVGALSGGWSMTAQCEEKKEEVKGSPKRMDFVGVFLDAASQAALKERFPALHADVSGQTSVVLKYNPTKEELQTFAPILGQTTTVKVQAVAQDDHSQAAIVAVTAEHGDVHYSVECPHITLSHSGEEGYARAYSNVLLERLQATGNLTVEESADGLNVGIANFDGDLPAFDSKLFPLPFPSTAASLRVLDDPLVLHGVLCTASSYDADAHACAASVKKAECGFCLFMKAGPCGAEFTAWETCLDESKKNGQDFLTVCGPQTLALRDCVDANPDYYSVLNGDSKDDADDDEEVATQDDTDKA
ncbi:Aste57867_3785 [Aphanomyces stellatus]|uniref:Aste57867_3785 protein n=1 Tax=Aphanomyces stellatus TaxID=120398 RepID=A0A485KAB6_9STRA|nr:hypothetical protein As57867_003774 [Aphanomyces stellatus]VFT80935.1 Aste57867_3785 [Aphanomyces stellatus]